MLIKRSEPAAHAEVSFAFRGDEVARLRAALADWKPSKRICDEQSCRDDLAFFLHERGHHIRSALNTGLARAAADAAWICSSQI